MKYNIIKPLLIFSLKIFFCLFCCLEDYINKPLLALLHLSFYSFLTLILFFKREHKNFLVCFKKSRNQNFVYSNLYFICSLQSFLHKIQILILILSMVTIKRKNVPNIESFSLPFRFLSLPFLLLACGCYS